MEKLFCGEALSVRGEALSLSLSERIRKKNYGFGRICTMT